MVKDTKIFKQARKYISEGSYDRITLDHGCNCVRIDGTQIVTFTAMGARTIPDLAQLGSREIHYLSVCFDEWVARMERQACVECTSEFIRSLNKNKTDKASKPSV